MKVRCLVRDAVFPDDCRLASGAFRVLGIRTRRFGPHHVLPAFFDWHLDCLTVKSLTASTRVRGSDLTRLAPFLMLGER